jgi:hypothetical protein
MVLGPLLYVLYTAPLFSVIARPLINLHQYADDLPLYMCVPPSEASIATNHLDKGILDVKTKNQAES